ncbi:MAG TPA: Fic family protein [Longimicrobium sp.]|jgi:Fic family protein
MSFNRDEPFNDLPPLPPNAELETRAVLKQLIRSRTALADLKGAGSLIPNQAILIQTLGVQEARSSSEIENVVTTSDQLYRALADAPRVADAATKEVLFYTDALWFGFQAVRDHGRPLTTRLFEEMVGIIKQSDVGVRRVPGTKLANPAGDVIYTPPEGESRLRDLLKNLEEFLYTEDELDPLVRMAVMHYQFEAIHPFTDGNGRTGRIANILFLVERGLLDTPVLYLSRFILERKREYYQGLRDVTEAGSWERWILYMLEAVEKTARHTEGRIRAIQFLMEHWIERVRRERPSVYSRELLEIVFQRPYAKIRFVEEAGIATRQTASKYLQSLVDLGLLRAVASGREVYFLNDPLLHVLVE